MFHMLLRQINTFTNEKFPDSESEAHLNESMNKTVFLSILRNG